MQRGVFCFGGIYLPKAATAPRQSLIFNKPGKEKKHMQRPASVLQSLEKGSKISQRPSLTYSPVNKYCEARWGLANSNSTVTTLSVVGQNSRLGDGTHTRKVFPQWPQTTLIPSGWMGSAGWAGCSSGITITGLRLIVRLLLEERRDETWGFKGPIFYLFFFKYFLIHFSWSPTEQPLMTEA